MNSTHMILIASAALAGCVTGVPQREEASKVPTMTTLPKDIYPDSRSRLPLPKRDALDEQGKRVYDSVLDPKRPTLAGFQGPAGIWLHSPRVGEPSAVVNITALMANYAFTAVMLTAFDQHLHEGREPLLPLP